jgi:hypothetical protein
MATGPTDEELAEKLGTLDIPVEGFRRPVLVETVIAAGMEVLRPGAKNSRNVLIRLIAEIKRLTAKADRADVLQLRVHELERKLEDAQAVFTEVELSRIRTYHKYGMSVSEIASLFNADANRVRRALGKKERPLERGLEPQAPKHRKRSLDI